MKRETIKKVSATELVVNKSVNFRVDYDVPSMMEEIMQQGRILEPIHARKDDKVVLKGNRRIAAAQELLKREDLSPELRKALESVDVFYYTDLTERELTELVLDHGSQKPLSRVETVMAVWRLQRQMYSERDIITLLYQQLARYTGNTKKAYEAQHLPAGQGREEFLQKWLHGTVGNFLMAAGQMGELVREQLILTETKLDRALTEDETKRVKFDVKRDRVNALSSAKKKDKEGKGWSPEAGGETFNALIEKFIDEDKNGKAPASRKITSEQMEQTADAMHSGMRLAFLQCAGKLPEAEKSKLDTLDTEYHRRDKVLEAITVDVDRVENEGVKALLRAILHGTPAEVTESMKPFLAASAS